MKKNRDEHYAFIKAVLSKEKALLSEDITNILHKKYGIEINTAKVKLSRWVKEKRLFNSAPLVFDNGSYAYSLNNSNNNYWDIVMQKKPLLGNILQRIKKNGGLISQLEVMKISGCLKSYSKKYYYYEKVFNDISYFLQVEKLQLEDSEFIVETKIKDTVNLKYVAIRKKEYVNCSMLPIIIKFLKTINLINGKNTPHYRNKSMPFSINNTITNNLVFDLSAFTQTTGFKDIDVDKQRPKQPQKTMIVLDINIAEDYSYIDYLGFQKRVNNLLFSTKKNNVRRIMPIVVYKKADKQIENYLANANYFCIPISKIFGKMGDNIVDFINKDYDEHTVGDFTDILNKLELSGQEEMLITFKGYVFEMLVERILREKFNTSNMRFRTNIMVGSSENKAEIDILLEDSDKNLIIFECKSSKNKIQWHNDDNPEDNNSAYAKHFFNTTLGKLVKEFGNGKFFISMISANGFDDKTLERVNKGALDNKKYINTKLLYTIDELINETEEEIKKRSNSMGDISKEKEIIEKCFVIKK